MKCSNLTKYQQSNICKKNSQQRMNEKKQDLQAEAEHVTFTVNGKPIKRVNQFLYLGRQFDDNDDDTYYINSNMRKA